MSASSRPSPSPDWGQGDSILLRETFRGRVGVAKPDAAIFGLALDMLAVSAAETWYVGDSLHTDVAGARAAGLTAVWLNRHGSNGGQGDSKPDLEIEIESLTELFTARGVAYWPA